MKKFLIILLIIILAFIVFLYVSGLFTSIMITEKVIGPFQLVYLDYKGPYSGIGKVQMQVYDTLLKDFKIETFKGFGIYYDDPKTVKPENCRSIGGCILEPKDYIRIPQLKKKLKVMNYPATRCMSGEFPFKNRISILLGVFKAYPALMEYMKVKKYTGGPSMEIYSMADKKIIYAMPIKKK